MAEHGNFSTLSEALKLMGSENYAIWKFRIKTLLQKEDLWEMVTIEDALAGQEGSDEDIDEVQMQSQYTYRQKNHVWSLLCLLVRDEVIPHIANIEDLAQIWRTLKSLYENSGNAQKLYLESKLHSLRMEERGKVANFLKKIWEVTNKLSAIGDLIKEHEIVEHILNSMPESYDNIINTIGCRSIYPPLTKLMGILIHEEVHWELQLTKRATAEVLMVKVKGQAKGAKSTFWSGCRTECSKAEAKCDDSGRKSGTTAGPNK